MSKILGATRGAVSGGIMGAKQGHAIHQQAKSVGGSVAVKGSTVLGHAITPYNTAYNAGRGAKFGYSHPHAQYFHAAKNMSGAHQF